MFTRREAMKTTAGLAAVALVAPAALAGGSLVLTDAEGLYVMDRHVVLMGGTLRDCMFERCEIEVRGFTRLLYS